MSDLMGHNISGGEIALGAQLLAERVKNAVSRRALVAGHKTARAPCIAQADAPP